jgi:predicted tellurium resistance membrane protein TerC
LSTKALVIALAYIVGWLTAMVAIRVYSNLILPIIINFFIWGCLVGVSVLYLLVLQRLYTQGYDLLHYWAYLMIVAAGLFAMVGLHLVIEGHDLRPFSIPLLIISLIQLGLIVFRYVFTGTANPTYLWKDLLFFVTMGIVSFYMLAHVGLLKPLRTRLTNYFDRNSKMIRTED